MGIAIGIDLGTTYSAVAMIDSASGRPRIIPNADGGALTPSVVACDHGHLLVGSSAKEEQESGNPDVAAFFKRYMGDESHTFQLGDREYTPIELSSMLLRELANGARQSCGNIIDGAVITCPAYFTNREREATIQAAEQAGINVLGILNEPTAAAFAYGVNGRGNHQTVLIYDLGGGTFDVTLAQVDGREIRILGSDGSHYLGGKDWDDAVSIWIADRFKGEFGIDPLDDAEMQSELAVLAETAKKRLTKATQATVTVKYHGKKGHYTLERATFDEITGYRLHETADIVERLFNSFTPHKSWADVDGTILVGGSTRMCQVHDYVERMTGKPPLGGVNVEEAVALGAAIRANQNAEGLAAFTAPTIGGERRATPLPLIGGRKIIDATSHALGMISESKDRERYVNDILIAKNSPIPASNTQRRELRVGKSGGELDVYLLQGSYPAPLDNEVAGKYVFTDIPYVDGGASLIDVTYRYDANGVIQVSAVQTETGKQLPMHRESIPDDMSWASGAPKSGNGWETIWLCFDLSGSMEGRPLRTAQKAACRFVEQFAGTPIDIGILSFSNDMRADLEPTTATAHVNKAIMSLQVRGGTTADPFVYIRKRYSAAKRSTGAVIVLTDGEWFTDDDPIEEAARCNELGIDTIAIGFGEAREDFLKAVSSRKDLATLTDLSHLEDSFSTIARVIGDTNPNA